MSHDQDAPDGLVEIRVHGRGGQGNVAAAELLAQAAFLAGREVQAFPAFGAERTGAPVVAFVRIDERPIRLRSQVYTPRHVMVQDASLLASNLAGIVAGLRSEGLVLLNAPAVPETLAAILPPDARAVAIPATSIALEAIGRPVPNTTLLGAYAALTDLVPLDAVRQAIRQRFAGDLAERNIVAAERGHAAAQGAVVARASAGASPPPAPGRSDSDVGPTIGLVAAPGSSAGPDGYHTGSWRVFRPVWDLAKCNDCRLCAVYCPEAVVVRRGPRDYSTSLDFCKGCGLCVAECQPKAIALVREDDLVAAARR
jgi:pyruvate ferredoxin oxidoreductase gamma subunit